MKPLLVLLALLPAAARGYEFAINAETIGQGYQLRAGNDALVNRRRITQYLSLDVYDLGPKDIYGRALERNQFYISMQLRFDSELGDYENLRELSGRTPQRELSQARLDLLWAHAGVRNLGGFMDLRLGRQIIVDLFDFQSFDGLAVEARTPFHLAFEAWGGLRVAGTAPFDSLVFRTDGVALGGNAAGSLAARQEEAYQPTFGIAAKLWGLRDIQARVSYLRTASFTGEPRPEAEPTSGVIDERVAVTVRGRLFGIVIPWAAMRWDILGGRLGELQAGARFFIKQAHSLAAEYVFAAPTFDGDSIWNVFGSEAFNDARLTYDGAFGRFRVFARGFARFFADHKTSYAGVDPGPLPIGPSLAAGGSAGARADFMRGFVRLDGYYEDGYGGEKGGVDASARVRVWGSDDKGLGFDGRISYIYFDQTHSFGLQAGVRWAITQGAVFHVLVEENTNRFYASQFRLLALLDLSFLLGPRGQGFSRVRGFSAMPIPGGAR
jgi:hypothetical protein